MLSSIHAPSPPLVQSIMKFCQPVSQICLNVSPYLTPIVLVQVVITQLIQVDINQLTKLFLWISLE